MNWSNYDDVLGQLRAAGLLVDTLEIGRRQRCRIDGDREKRGWYHLHELRTDAGDALIVGSYGIWRGADPGSAKVEIRKGAALSADQRAALKARMAADRKAAEIERRSQAARAARRAASMWDRMETSGESEYLTRKAIGGHGVRYWRGSIIVPLLDVAGQIHGLQAIYPADHPKRKRLGRDKDFWPAGLAKQGHFFAIGSPPVGSCCLLCEGYATGASLYEATGLPTVVAFDAGNLLHVGQALRKRWPGLRILVCADDDAIGRCPTCGKFTPVGEPRCTHCQAEHGRRNAGVTDAAATALAVSGEWLAPAFARPRADDAKGPTDFNDLHVLEGLQAVRAQIEAKLTAIQWRGAIAVAAVAASNGGRGDGDRGAMASISTVEELQNRYVLVYEAAETVFDAQEHKLVPLASMRNLCTSRQVHRGWMESADKRVVRLDEVGFDPSESDATIKCNLWSGWPTRPRAGKCDALLELGEYLCSNDPAGDESWAWLRKWVAYPLQHPGAKMKTAVVVHGPQGTGKNLFFEAVLGMYGPYGQVVDQDTIEDKYNDYLSRKLFLVADEVVARQEMWHQKNKLKVLVTSDWIRINPKFVASYKERNHVNLVFLSNEVQPMALERDDRRYAVIWTPAKLDASFYHRVLAEIHAGGIAALHDYMLNLPLGDFGPATLPPMTSAKEDLIDLGMESSERFFAEWTKRYLPIPATHARTEDLYDAYRHWCSRNGVAKPAQLSTFVGSIAKRPGVRKERRHHWRGHSRQVTTQSMVISAPGAQRIDARDDLSVALSGFADAVTDWRSAHAGLAGSVGGKRRVAVGGSDDA